MKKVKRFSRHSSNAGFILPIVLVIANFISFALAVDLQGYIHELRLTRMSSVKIQLLNTMETALYSLVESKVNFNDLAQAATVERAGNILKMEFEWLDTVVESDIRRLKVSAQWVLYDGDAVPYKWFRTAIIERRPTGLYVRGVVQ